MILIETKVWRDGVLLSQNIFNPQLGLPGGMEFSDPFVDNGMALWGYRVSPICSPASAKDEADKPTVVDA